MSTIMSGRTLFSPLVTLSLGVDYCCKLLKDKDGRGFVLITVGGNSDAKALHATMEAR